MGARAQQIRVVFVQKQFSGQMAKVIADQIQKDNPILSKLWVVLLPGCPGQQAIPRYPLLPVDLLDNSQADRIEPDLLRQLLSAG